MASEGKTNEPENNSNNSNNDGVDEIGYPCPEVKVTVTPTGVPVFACAVMAVFFMALYVATVMDLRERQTSACKQSDAAAVTQLAQQKAQLEFQTSQFKNSDAQMNAVKAIQLQVAEDCVKQGHAPQFQGMNVTCPK